MIRSFDEQSDGDESTPQIEVCKAFTFDSLDWDSDMKPSLSTEQIEFFRDRGYLVIENFLRPDIVEKVRNRYEPVFGGEFDTGVYPDEWYGRPGMCDETMTKEICNAWKSDRTIASVVLSSHLHRITAQLHDWSCSRIAQDDILWKPQSGGTPVGFHRDATYISPQFIPRDANSVTVWMPLDDVSLETGSLEYIESSQHWTESNKEAKSENVSLETFHTHTSKMGEVHKHRRKVIEDKGYFIKASAQVMTDGSQYVDSKRKIIFNYVEIPKGGVAFHHQDLVHGSGPNLSENFQRRVLVLHALRGDCKFDPLRQPTYIYGRYKLRNGERQGSIINDGEECSLRRDCELHDSFFPVCWGQPKDLPLAIDNHDTNLSRSTWLESYCQNVPPVELFIRR